MVKNWSLEGHTLSPKEQKIQAFTEKATGYRFPTLSHKFASIFSLYNFLNKYQNADPSTLHITDENGKPMFSLDDLKEIQATIRHQTSHPMTNDNARRIIAHVKNVYAPAINVAESMKGGSRRRRRAGRRTSRRTRPPASARSGDAAAAD